MIFFFDVRVHAVLGGTSIRVIDTAFVYYLTWHGEKNRGTELKPRVVLGVLKHGLFLYLIEYSNIFGVSGSVLNLFFLCFASVPKIKKT